MTTSQSRRLLTILALLELCVLVALAGSVLRSRGDQDVAIDALLPTNCPGTARVRPKQLRAVNRDVDAELDRLLRELELGPRSTRALISVERQARTEWNLARAGRLAGQARAEEKAAVQRGRDRLLRSAGLLMAPDDATAFELALTTAWDAAWTEHGPTTPRGPGSWSGESLSWSEGDDQDALWLGSAFCLVAHGLTEDEVSRTRTAAGG